MYYSAAFINIKQDQDYADFAEIGHVKKLVLCDGIGSFKDSRKVAELVVNTIIKDEMVSLKELIQHPELDKKKYPGIEAGTTVIFAHSYRSKKVVKVEYLGNGSIIHCFGNYADTRITEVPYMYSDLMIPHIDPDDALTRHLSHESSKAEHISGKIELELNYKCGDIMLFMTDGIASLEHKIIIQDNEGRYWRSEVPAIQTVLQELDKFLMTASRASFADDLVNFNKHILAKLKSEKYLEDDASLGIIITDDVIKYYHSIHDTVAQ